MALTINSRPDGLPEEGEPSGPSAREILDRIDAAITGDELRLVYQPQFDLRTGRLVAAEALVRWTTHDGMTFQPSRFIPLIERSESLRPFTNWVFDTAVANLSRLRRLGPRVTMAVNLSPNSLADPALVSDLDRIIARHDCDPSLIELEITETAAIENLTTAADVLGELRERGYTIALDDFGTGNSTLSHLTHLPVDILKIDRTFVHDLPNDALHLSVVVSTIKIAHSLGLRVVGEGIESLAEQRLLAQAGCDRGQGYRLGRPKPFPALAHRLRRRLPRRDLVL